MARIRSIHPGIWTDEHFVEMSPQARLFMLGLWNEADDYGVLEWRPTKLKMRLAPADAVDAAALMDEIAEAGFIVRVERGGKAYAVIKNFRKWQRPKNPSNPIIDLDWEIRAIISLPQGDTSTPALPQPSPSKGETSPQMEEGGDKREEEEEGSDAIASGAGAPPLSTIDRVWLQQVPILVSLSGSKEADVRKRVGKALSKFPPDDVHNAFAAAIHAKSGDPFSYATRILVDGPKARGSPRHAPPLDPFLAIKLSLEQAHERHDHDDEPCQLPPRAALAHDDGRPVRERAGARGPVLLDLAPARADRR
jgi:hypothetical protein